jgi:uncharacterized protein (DUF302 family)
MTAFSMPRDLTRRRTFAWLSVVALLPVTQESRAMNMPIAGPPPCRTAQFASSFGFEETVARLEAAMDRAGLSVFARIDHAAGAREAGLQMPPTLVLVYGSPRGGTPLMLADPTVALDLPLRALVRQDVDGTVFVAYHPVAETLRRPGLPEASWVRLEPAQHLLHAALAAERVSPPHAP